MLGEKRSRAAFQGDSLESVQTGGGAYTGKQEVKNTQTGNTEAGNGRTEKTFPPSNGEEYLDSLLSDCLGRADAGCSGSAGKAMEDDRGTTPAFTDESRQIRRDAGNRTENTNRPVAEETRQINVGDMETTVEESPESEEECAVPRRDVRMLRTHGLFFEADPEGRDFSSVLKEVQAYLSKEYSSLVTADGS